MRKGNPRRQDEATYRTSDLGSRAANSTVTEPYLSTDPIINHNDILLTSGARWRWLPMALIKTSTWRCRLTWLPAPTISTASNMCRCGEITSSAQRSLVSCDPFDSLCEQASHLAQWMLWRPSHPASRHGRGI